MDSIPKISPLLAFLLFYCFLAVHGFNLDTWIPVIKRGQPRSFFGFSVAQHQSLPSSLSSNLLLIGAPRANTSQPGTVNPGTVFVCPMTTRRTDCTEIDLTNFTKNQPPPRTLVDTVRNITEQDNPDNGWLGVSVKSRGPGGPVAACAHRYTRAYIQGIGKDALEENTETVHSQGMCHIFNNNLRLDRDSLEPCAGKKTTRGYEDFAACQAGVASEWVEEESDTLVIGTPGTLTWRGSIFAIATDTDKMGVDRSWYYSEAPVDKVSYLGMAVTRGTYLGPGKKMVYVAGAPRSNLTGQVFLFRKQATGGNKSLEILARLDGEQVASQFGYSLATVDLNSDGFPDLVVGAPYYFQGDGQGGQKGGAVYIYMNGPDGVQKSKVKRLAGPSVESMFGLAVANAGDLNLDGFQDLAIGAPYDEGGGSVHVFQGTASGIGSEASQILRPKDLQGLSTPVATFGYSLSGGLDMDGNGYPDLLAGAYASDTSILLRARPVIKVITDVKDLPKYVSDPNQPKHCLDSAGKNLTCFEFRPCFTVASQSLQSFTGEMRIEYRIEAETFQKGNKAQYSRVKFQAGDQQTPNIVKRIVVVTANNWNLENCERETVLLQETAREFLNPVWFKLMYTLLQDPPAYPRENSPLPSVNNYPILDQANASKMFQVKFYKDCGPNDICESDLRLSGSFSLPRDSSGDYVLSLGENNQIYLNFTVRNENEAAYQTYVYIDHPAELEYIGSDSDLKQYPCSSVKENKDDIPTRIRCDIGNPFPRDGEANISIRLNTTNLRPLDRQVRVTLSANTTSTQVPEREPLVIAANIVVRADVEIRGASDPKELFYSGFVTGASAVKSEDQIGLTVNHTFEIRNRGPAKISSARVTIRWPFEVENGQTRGKYLLYLLQNPITDGPVDCTVSKEYVDPVGIAAQHLTSLVSRTDSSGNRGVLEKPVVALDATTPAAPSSDEPKSRKKRENIVQYEERKVDNKKIKVVQMNCDRKTAKCIEIVCQIRELNRDQPVVIRLRARLWNSTFMEDYRDIDTIEIRSRAEVVVDTSYAVEDAPGNNEVSILTFAKPDVSVKTETGGVAWWIILLAVLGGILLLVLLIILLWKCGFFKRKTPEESVRRQTPSDGMEPYESERMSPQSPK